MKSALSARAPGCRFTIMCAMRCFHILPDINGQAGNGQAGNGHTEPRVSQCPDLPATLPAALPAEGYLWIDVLRAEQPDWPALIAHLTGAQIDPSHVDDSFNRSHPPFFDGTADYDMLIVQGLGPGEAPLPVETRSTAFFIFERVLVTVREPDILSIQRAAQRLLDGRLKPPSAPLRLAQTIVDMMIDRFLMLREPLGAHLTELQDRLLSYDRKPGEWRGLLRERREVHQLIDIAEGQLDALQGWQAGSRHHWKQGDRVRQRDMTHHLNRVIRYASGQERDLDTALQLHFSAVANHTNQIMQTLTLLSAIFFPLTLIVGIYGMNFDHMPELHWRYGYFGVLGVMGAIAGGLVIYFRRRRLL